MQNEDYEGEFPAHVAGPKHITKLHYLAELAHLGARCAWLHPEDPSARMEAQMAAAVLGVDYFGELAAHMHRTKCSPDEARFMIAEAFRTGATKLAAAGG